MKKLNWKKIAKHLYKPVVCIFDDHAHNSTPVYCQVVGFLAKVTDEFIVIVSWDCPEFDGDDRIANMEYFSIVRSAIKKIELLGAENRGNKRRKKR